MGTTVRNKLSFLSQRSTFIVVFIRIIFIFLPQAVSNNDNDNNNGISILFPFIPQEWIYSPALMSILVRSQYTLKHVREAIAIQNLSSSSTTKQLLLSDVYNPSQSIRLPPLLLMSIKSFVEYYTTNTTKYHHELYIKIFLLIVDILIATLIEGIGRNILLFKFKQDDDEIDNNEDEEDEEEKVILPEVIQPPNSHIFPISYYSSNSSSPPPQEGEEESKTNSTTMTKKRPPQSPLLPLESIPLLSSQLYFCSILFVALPADLYCCYQNITTLFLVASIYESSKSRSRRGRRGGRGRDPSSKSLSTFFLAIATYIEPHHIAFLIPVIIFHNTNTINTINRNKNLVSSSILLPVVLFGIWSLSLQYLSYYSVIIGDGGGGSRTNFYGNILGTIYGCGWKNMGPNLSVQWYFHMQLFSRFRSYFGTLVLGLPYVMVGPLAIRLYKYPMELVAIFSLLWTIMRPVEILYDVNISLCFMLLCPRTLARIGKLSLVAIISMWVPVLLYIVDYWMWLEPGTGNANYIFFQCLAYNVFLGMILGQFVSACVQRDKALRLVRKEEKERSDDDDVTATTKTKTI